MPEEIKIVYYPSDNFNGVLFLLREPHTNDEPEKAFKGNEEWYTKKICNNENRDRQQKRYYNRFCEMLSSININKKYRKPEYAAFTNIKLTGGGSVASKEYWKIDPEEKKSIIDGIIANNREIKIVFTCSDIFESLSEKWNSLENNGIRYPSKKKQQMRKCKYRNVTFYEILHPSRSPRIAY